MTDFLNAVQGAVYTALNGNLGSGVSLFDTPPFLPEGAPDTSFPYVVLGQDDMDSWDNDSQLGAEVIFYLHFWSRAEGMQQVKTIMGAAYTALHRASLTATGYTVVDCLHEFSEVMLDPDGVLKHGIQRYSLVIQKGA